MGSARFKLTSRVWLLATLTILTSAVAGEGEPTPKPWPEQFHSVLVMNYSGQVEIIDLWYDWPKGRNFNIIHHQLGKVYYDLEWNNGTSFVYTLDDDKECETLDVGVGILTPNWLAGANYLGQKEFAGFLCNVWEKVEFIWYYEDVVTRRPVYWQFYTGRSAHVMTFEVGAVLDDSEWQAPVYCFERTAEHNARAGVDSARALRGGFKGAIAGSVALL